MQTPLTGAVRSVPAPSASTPTPTTNSDSFTGIFLHACLQQSRYNLCGGSATGLVPFQSPIRTETQWLEILASWTPAAPTDTGAAPPKSEIPSYELSTAVRLRLSEQKVAVAIATSVYTSRHPEQDEPRGLTPWGYPPAGASGNTMAVWAKMERFLQVKSGSVGLEELRQRCADLTPCQGTQKELRPANQESRALYAPIWDAIGNRIQQLRQELVQLRQGLSWEEHALQEAPLLDLLLARVRHLAAAPPPSPDTPRPTFENKTQKATPVRPPPAPDVATLPAVNNTPPPTPAESAQGEAPISLHTGEGRRPSEEEEPWAMG